MTNKTIDPNTFGNDRVSRIIAQKLTEHNSSNLNSSVYRLLSSVNRLGKNVQILSDDSGSRELLYRVLIPHYEKCVADMTALRPEIKTWSSFLMNYISTKLKVLVLREQKKIQKNPKGCPCGEDCCDKPDPYTPGHEHSGEAVCEDCYQTCCSNCERCCHCDL